MEEYHFFLHIAHSWMDPYGHVRKALELGYAHVHHVEDFWENYQDDKEVHARNYMQMIAYFVKRVQLFPIPDQVEEDESTIMDSRYNAIASLSLLAIDWDEEEDDDLDIITKPIMAHTKEWVNGQVA